MPDVSLKDSTFQRLQRNAIPFVDTPDAVINRALDALENGRDRQGPAVDSPAAERRIDSLDPPNLRHTRVLSASVAGESISKPNWNRLVETVVVLAMSRLGHIDELRRACPVNLVHGRKVDEGYRYLDEINLSFQGVDANDACRALVTTAHSVGIELDVTFLWRSKKGAAYPGEKGRLFIAGAQDS